MKLFTIKLIVASNLNLKEVKYLCVGRNKELTSGFIIVLNHKDRRLNSVTYFKHFSEAGNSNYLITCCIKLALYLLNEGSVAIYKPLNLGIISNVAVSGEI